MHMHGRWLVGAVVTVVLAGCGGAAATSSPGVGATAAPPGGPTLTAQDYFFTPSTISVSPGATVTLTYTNNGSVTHNFTQADLHVSQDVSPGSSQTITFTAPQSGTLSFHCQYHPTKMMGTIVVGTGGGAAPPTSAASSPTATGNGY